MPGIRKLLPSTPPTSLSKFSHSSIHNNGDVIYFEGYLAPIVSRLLCKSKWKLLCKIELINHIFLKYIKMLEYFSNGTKLCAKEISYLPFIKYFYDFIIFHLRNSLLPKIWIVDLWIRFSSGFHLVTA